MKKWLENLKSTGLIIIVVSLCIALLFIGVTIGVVGTINVMGHVAVRIMEGTNIVINNDINETKLVNDMYLINEFNKDTEGIALLGWR